MIVKVQMPLLSSSENPGMLIYNEDRSVNFICYDEELFQSMREAEVVKAYFNAELQGSNLVFNSEAEEQAW